MLKTRYRKSGFLVAAALLLFASGALAQQGNRADMMTQRLKEQLALTDSQSVLVHAVFDSMMVQAAKDRDAHGGDRDAMMSAARERMERADKQIEAILTADQLKKYQEYKEERQQRFGRRQREN